MLFGVAERPPLILEEDEWLGADCLRHFRRKYEPSSAAEITLDLVLLKIDGLVVGDRIPVSFHDPVSLLEPQGIGSVFVVFTLKQQDRESIKTESTLTNIDIKTHEEIKCMLSNSNQQRYAHLIIRPSVVICPSSQLHFLVVRCWYQSPSHVIVEHPVDIAMADEVLWVQVYRNPLVAVHPKTVRSFVGQRVAEGLQSSEPMPVHAR